MPEHDIALLVGVVLTGGRSSRMKTDKAFLPIDGAPMVRRVVDALRAAGTHRVILVGGNESRLREAAGGADVYFTADRWPEQGPLAGVVSAMIEVRRAHDEAGTPDPLLVVLSCDLPRLGRSTIGQLLAVLRGDAALDAAVAVVGGVRQVQVLAVRARTLEHLRREFSGGERSLTRALRSVRVGEVAEVDGIDASTLCDLDTPEQFEEYAHRSRVSNGPDGIAANQPAGGPRVDVPEIDVATLAELLDDGAVVLDVRNPDEYTEGHVPGAVLVPLADLAERVDDVPKTDGEPLYVVCAMGGRSHKAAEYLRAQGLDAVNVAGGTMGWIEQGNPVVSGPEPS